MPANNALVTTTTATRATAAFRPTRARFSPDRPRFESDCIFPHPRPVTGFTHCYWPARTFITTITSVATTTLTWAETQYSPIFRTPAWTPATSFERTVRASGRGGRSRYRRNTRAPEYASNELRTSGTTQEIKGEDHRASRASRLSTSSPSRRDEFGRECDSTLRRGGPTPRFPSG